MGSCFSEKKNNNSLKNTLINDKSDNLSLQSNDKKEKINSP